MKTELLRGLAVVLDNGDILLSLRNAQLGPELNDLVAESLNRGDAARVLFVNTGKLGIEPINVVW